MFKGSLLFIAIGIPQLVFLRVLVKPNPDAGVIVGFIAVSLICTFLSISMIVRYIINIRRSEIDGRAEATQQAVPSVVPH